MDIGFIGVGQMGSRMAKRLLDAGYKLTVNDINRNAARALSDRGARWADTPKAVAESCPVVISMLPGPPEVEQVVYGHDGLMAGWKKCEARSSVGMSSAEGSECFNRLRDAFRDLRSYLSEAEE